MRLGSLFAGIGGFDLAAERVGMTVEWQSEVDKKASAVLDHHWPEVPNYGDIRNIRAADGADISERAWGSRGGNTHAGRNRPGDSHGQERTNGTTPAVDVLTGGFPCQDYSVAGKRDGLAGDRGALWWEYHRLIDSIRPTWVVGENVPGLLSSRGGADFETIVGSLTECGYGVAWAVLDAQYFGVAQRRRRVFIVGHFGGKPRPEVLALGEGLFGHPEPSRETGKDVAPTLASRTRGGGGLGTDSELGGALVASPSGFGGFEVGKVAGTLRKAASPLAFAQNQRDEVRDLGDKAGALAAEPGMKQQTYVFEDDRRTGPRLHDEVAPTLQAFMGSGGNNEPMTNFPSVRRLTPLECERLQGFPDGWTDIPGNSDTQRYRQLGNAVAVPVVEWILRNIMEEVE